MISQKFAKGFSFRRLDKNRISERVFVKDAILNMLSFEQDTAGTILYTVEENNSYESGVTKFSHKKCPVSKRLNKAQYHSHAEQVLISLLEQVKRERSALNDSHGSKEA